MNSLKLKNKTSEIKKQHKRLVYQQFRQKKKKGVFFLKNIHSKQGIKTLKIRNIVRSSKICVIEILRKKKGGEIVTGMLCQEILRIFPTPMTYIGLQIQELLS